MALLDKVVVERWIAVASIALQEAEKKERPLIEVLSGMSKLPGWPGRVAWLLVTDQSRLALVLEWLKSGVRPNPSLIKYLKEHMELMLSSGE